jgi:hypothetical protein
MRRWKQRGEGKEREEKEERRANRGEGKREEREKRKREVGGRKREEKEGGGESGYTSPACWYNMGWRSSKKRNA